MSEVIKAAISESLFGFHAGRGKTDAIFIVHQISEKAKEHGVGLHLHFIDFKFDTVWRESLWQIL